ncbi:hypothetical protein [Aliamphritea ceti]|uniref:hypothetical protein n=1 Tax=Aliamphritea ceti TaxID=1524258 RepID=UPI0021C45639|nr:hypothetical protein [Aliamphritea ceti]
MNDSATKEDPVQGDHIFGDIIGTIDNVMKRIFKTSMQNELEIRMNSYDNRLYEVYTTIIEMNCGHLDETLISNRQRGQELDKHSYEFGKASYEFQKELYLISGELKSNTNETLIIGGSIRWKYSVLDCYQKIMEVLIDETALKNFFKGNPKRETNENEKHSPQPLTINLGNFITRETRRYPELVASVRNTIIQIERLESQLTKILNFFLKPIQLYNRKENIWEYVEVE